MGQSPATPSATYATPPTLEVQEQQPLIAPKPKAKSRAQAKAKVVAEPVSEPVAEPVVVEAKPEAPPKPNIVRNANPTPTSQVDGVKTDVVPTNIGTSLEQDLVNDDVEDLVATNA